VAAAVAIESLQGSLYLLVMHILLQSAQEALLVEAEQAIKV
jgi:hypothetical protein